MSVASGASENIDHENLMFIEHRLSLYNKSNSRESFSHSGSELVNNNSSGSLLLSSEPDFPINQNAD